MHLAYWPDHQRTPEASRVGPDCQLHRLQEHCYDAVACDNHGHHRGAGKVVGAGLQPAPTMRFSPSARSLEW